MSSLSSFSAAGSSANGALVGDSMLTTIQTTLGNIVSGTTGGSTLGALGISLQSDGQLTIDTTTLTNAVTNDPAQVASVFNGTNGIAEQLNTSINAFTGTDGVIADRSTELSDDITSVQTQQTALAAYTAQLTSQYNNEFTALNNLMATTNENSQYLTQLFGGADSAGAMATASSE